MTSIPSLEDPRWLRSFRRLVLRRRIENKIANARAKLAWLLGMRGANPLERQPLPPVRHASIPKRLWLYWHQGEDAAPELVKLCIQSWRERNPGWDMRVLDAATADEAVEMPALPADISLNHRANVLRMRLLEEHGGVWVDATCYCSRPLDHWLPVLARTGFFVFTWPAPDDQFYFPAWRRAITNWFIASEPGGVLISRWSRQTSRYWRDGGRPDHYFWHHYLFEWLCRNDREFREAWRQVPTLGALGPHLALRFLETGRDEAQLRAALASGAIPLHKLSWKLDLRADDVRSLLERP